MTPKKLVFKVNTLGGTGSGKTTIIEVVQNEWKGTTTSTLGISIGQPLYLDFTRHQIFSGNLDESKINYDSKFIVWDLGGQTKYHQLLYGFLPGSHGQICVVDGTNPRSAESLLAQLFLSAQVLDEFVPIAILINKKDLYEQLNGFNTLCQALASIILESLSLVDFPEDKSGQCLVNYWLLESILINGKNDKAGLVNLTEKPIMMFKDDGTSIIIDLRAKIGLENLKLLARYLLLLLIDNGQQETFQGTSEYLPVIDFERPGMIDPKHLRRAITVNAAGVKEFVSRYNACKKDSQPDSCKPLLIELFKGYDPGKGQMERLKKSLELCSSEQLKEIAARYNQRLTDDQVECLKNWIKNAKIYETTATNQFFVKNVVIDALKKVHSSYVKR
ncbi:MAG: Rab family GTPase [Candidatus Hodarchaeales archaeon]